MTWSTDPFAANPTANSLRSGTAYSFRFDAGAPPVSTTASLGLFKPGTPAVLSGVTQGPAAGPMAVPAMTHPDLLIATGFLMVCGAFVLRRS